MKLSISFLILFLLAPLFGFTQDLLSKQSVDSLYREDQIYLGITVNFLNKRPFGVFTESFVGGINFGFLRDMPINKRRNLAIAAGLGYAYNNYGQNLFVGIDETGNSEFMILFNPALENENRFETHEIELPIELRWRTSTPEDYKFWRVYGGVKLGYAFNYKFVLKEDVDTTLRFTSIDEFERLRYTAFLNFGYNTFNLQIQYTINSFFNKSALLEGEPFDMTAIKLGFMFYIL